MSETTLTTRWPTIAATSAGRLVGRWSALPGGFGVFTLGTLMAAVTIPISLTVFCWQLMPVVCRRYRLSDRRIVVQKGLSAVEERSIGLDEFDTVEIRVLPGQEWLRTGELLFLRDGQEVFRLSGVPRPQVFCEICLKQRHTLRAMGSVVTEPVTAGSHAAVT